MKTIINNSNHVITVSNTYFSKDIPINEILTISDEEINGDPFLNFKFFSLKEKNENKIEVEQTFGNQFGIWFSSTRYIPLQTKICIEKFDKITVGLKCAEFILISRLFKKFCIQKPTIEDCDTKQIYSFIDPKSKRKVKISFIVELFITIPIFFILSCLTLFSFIEAWGGFETISLSILAIISIYSNAKKMYYLTF